MEKQKCKLVKSGKCNYYHATLGICETCPRMFRHIKKTQKDNWDIFEDRAKSLLDRWRKFKDAHPDKIADCITSFLNEVGDSYTQNLTYNAKHYSPDKEKEIHEDVRKALGSADYER